MKDEVLHEAFENWKGLSGSEEEYFAYLSRFKQIMDEEAMVVEAEMRVKEGIEQGIKQGIEKGIEKGREIGQKLGKELGKELGMIEEKENTARKLFQMGMDIEVIMEATGLSEETIKKIIQ